MENRSTLTPSSANLMVQESPANPPPTTITRLFVGIFVCCQFPVVSCLWWVVGGWLCVDAYITFDRSKQPTTHNPQQTTDSPHHIIFPSFSRLSTMNSMW